MLGLADDLYVLGWVCNVLDKEIKDFTDWEKNLDPPLDELELIKEFYVVIRHNSAKLLERAEVQRQELQAKFRSKLEEWKAELLAKLLGTSTNTATNSTRRANVAQNGPCPCDCTVM
jgi:hypothetical protein